MRMPFVSCAVAALLLSACVMQPEATDAPDETIAQAFEREAAAAQAPAPAPEKPALFGFLRKKPEPTPPPVLQGTDITVISDAPDAQEDAPEGDTEGEGDVQGEEMAASAATASPVAQRPGLFARVFGGAGGAQQGTQRALVAPDAARTPLDGPEETGPAAAGAPVAPAPEEVGVQGDLEADSAAPAEAPRRGLFGPRRASGSGRAAATVAPGQVLPFGEVGLACGLRKSQMGREVDTFPREGRASWRLFDSAPGSTGPRSQFITGFSDGCPRQFTASLTTFGAPDVHETLRYSAPMKRVPYSPADTRYEALKTRLCGVGRGTPCPAGKRGRIEDSVVFVSVYHRFGDSKGWMELLLHNGKIEAQQIR